MRYLLGIDIGTTAAKALLLKESGQVVAISSSDYPLSTPRPLWSEQKPEDWWQATCACFRQIQKAVGFRPEQVAGIGLSGQMHGLVLLDQNGSVLRPAILWNDQRTGAQCERITRLVGFERLLDLTGNPVLPGFTAPKLIWIHENEPEMFAQTKHFLLPKDYVRFRLTGEYFTEVSDASGTSLFDVKRRTWSQAMFDALNIPISWAPHCMESVEITGRLSPTAASECGLAAGTPVVGGGGDQAAQAIGTGLTREATVSVTLGTSGVVFAPTNSPRTDPHGRLHSFCHAVPGMWHVMGVMLAAGGSLRWYRDVFADNEKAKAAELGIDPYELLMAEAAKAPTGCEGLVFLPYLSGERTPYPDPNARGAFVGITLRHAKSHMIRAVLEGVGFGLGDSMELIRTQGIEPRLVRVSGGGARSALWRQILADIFGTEVATVSVTEGAALGAALLAGVGVGVFADVSSACECTIREDSRLSPDPAAVALYRRLYPQYRGLYRALKPSFDNTTAFVEPD